MKGYFMSRENWFNLMSKITFASTCERVLKEEVKEANVRYINSGIQQVEIIKNDDNIVHAKIVWSQSTKYIIRGFQEKAHNNTVYVLVDFRNENSPDFYILRTEDIIKIKYENNEKIKKPKGNIILYFDEIRKYKDNWNKITE